MKSRRRMSGAAEAMFKLILTGESGTGKSCLLNRYVKQRFDEEYHVTIGAEFESKVIRVDDNYRVKLQIWDTAGQETFRSIIKTFYRNSAAVILVYDLTKRKTFEGLAGWHAEARENAPKHAMFILMATHLDLEAAREVPVQSAEAWTRENSIDLFFETSAKADINVTYAFEEIAKQLFVGQLTRRQTIVLDEAKLGFALPEQAKSGEKKCCGG